MGPVELKSWIIFLPLLTLVNDGLQHISPIKYIEIHVFFM